MNELAKIKYLLFVCCLSRRKISHLFLSFVVHCVENALAKAKWKLNGTSKVTKSISEHSNRTELEQKPKDAKAINGEKKEQDKIYAASQS